MSKLIFGTSYVNFDEPCLLLTEQNFNGRRVQIIQVMRADKAVEFRKDLGNEKTFIASSFQIPGGVRDEVTGKFYIEHTVGELVDIAEALREKDIKKNMPPRNLLEEYARTLESRGVVL
jgi:hypothetical protein